MGDRPIHKQPKGIPTVYSFKETQSLNFLPEDDPLGFDDPKEKKKKKTLTFSQPLPEKDKSVDPNISSNVKSDAGFTTTTSFSSITSNNSTTPLINGENAGTKTSDPDAISSDPSLSFKKRQTEAQPSTEIREEKERRKLFQSVDETDDSTDGTSSPSSSNIYKFYHHYRPEIYIFVFLIFPFVAITWILKSFEIDYRLWGELLSSWSLALLYAWGIEVLAHFLVHLIWPIISMIVPRGDAIYFLSDMTTPTRLLLCGSLYAGLWRLALPNIYGDAEWFISRTIKLLLLVSIFLFLFTLIQKFISSQVNTDKWRDRLRKALLREEIVEKLIAKRERPPIKDKLSFFWKPTSSTIQNTTRSSSEQPGPSMKLSSTFFSPPNQQQVSQSPPHPNHPDSDSDDAKKVRFNQSNPSSSPSSSPSHSIQMTELTSHDIESATHSINDPPKSLPPQPTNTTFQPISILSNSMSILPSDSLTNQQEVDELLQVNKLLEKNENIFTSAWESPIGKLMEKAGWSKTVRTQNAKLYTKQIWNNLCMGTKREYVELIDFWDLLRSDELSEVAMNIFDVDQIGQVTKQNITTALEVMFDERKSLVNTLKDRDNVSSILKRIFFVIFWFIMCIVALYVFDLDVNALFFSTITIFVGLSFAFGTAFRNTVESIIFLFVTNPFDVGDRVVIPSIDNMFLKVSKIKLMSTYFVRGDGKQMIVPNYVLYDKPIHNLKRSKNVTFPFAFQLGHQNSVQKLRIFKNEIKAFLERNPRGYFPKFDFVIEEIEDTNRIRIRLWVELNNKWGNIDGYIKLRTQFQLQAHKICTQHGIEYFQPTQIVKLLQDNGQNQQQHQQQHTEISSEYPENVLGLISPRS